MSNDTQPSQGTIGTPFIQFMLTAIPAAIVVVAGWLFGNIFAELQHQRQRQENLVREVTGINRDLISLTTQFVDLREFYRQRYIDRDAFLSKLEKDILETRTRILVQQQAKELQAIKEISKQKTLIDKSKPRP